MGNVERARYVCEGCRGSGANWDCMGENDPENCLCENCTGNPGCPECHEGDAVNREAGEVNE